MFNTENLLRNEVFPAELPPCFSTDDLAANATLAIATSNSFGHTNQLKISGLSCLEYLLNTPRKIGFLMNF